MCAKGGTAMITIQRFIAKICISLSFSVEACCHFAPPTASKLAQLLITTKRRAVTSRRREGGGGGVTNQFQREFDSNVAIRTFWRRAVTSRRRNSLKTSAPKNKRLQTEACLSLRAADTNRIQRENLFNNCIHSQNPFSASSPPRQKTNFLKRCILPQHKKSPLHQRACECSGDGDLGVGFAFGYSLVKAVA
jgi:hypothetical protein